MYVYNQDDRKPTPCGLVAAGKHHDYAKTHAHRRQFRDLFCSAVRPLV
jgi:hypothetical protein